MLKYRYFIQLSYKGTNYVGWQFQPNGLSIQESLEKALSLILRDEIKVTGAGRTDAGVHARFFIAHFDSIIDIIDIKKVIYSLNNYLSNDIAIQDIRRVNDDAHARFDALSRTYNYRVSTVKSPFELEFSYYLKFKPDIELMNKAAKLLFEFKDFTSFSKLHTDVKTNNCKIEIAEWKQEGDILIFVIKADRFLRNMVRAIVGTLLDVGNGKVSLEEFKTIIELKDRSEAGFSVPAQGLYLVGIEYPELGF